MTVTNAPTPRRPRPTGLAAVRLAALRAGLGVLDRLTPGLAARAAFSLWLRLPDTAGRRKDFRPCPGKVTSVRTERGTRVAVESWGDAGAPVVYLVHGWGGWRGQLGAFVTPLLERGRRVVAFDAPGHGESGQSVLGERRATVLEAIEAFAAVSDAFGPAQGVVAHSMGCSTAAMAVREYNVYAERLALVAPNHDFDSMTRDLAAQLGLSETVRAGMQARVERFTRRPMSDFDLVPLGADGALPPTLVVHDRDDKEVPYRVGAQLAETWPESELLTTTGLGHQRILTDAGVLTAIVDHVTV